MSTPTEVIADLEADIDGLREKLEEQRQYAARRLTAWQSARQRATSHLAALVEADEERDFLRARLRDRDDEVAELVVRLAEFSGLAS